MGDFRQKILTLVFLTAPLVVCGCAQDVPLKVYVEDTWTDNEVAIIRQCMDEWNRVGRERLSKPGPLLSYAGRRAGKFAVDDLNDGAHVVYRLGSPEETPDYLRYDNADCTGYATLGDVLIKTYAASEGTNRYFGRLHCVVSHEFGHLLGLPHYNAEPALMNEHKHACAINDADIRHFCAVYDCR
jgi:hypothetical protein